MHYLAVPSVNILDHLLQVREGDITEEDDGKLVRTVREQVL